MEENEENISLGFMFVIDIAGIFQNLKKCSLLFIHSFCIEENKKISSKVCTFYLPVKQILCIQFLLTEESHLPSELSMK